MGAHRHATDRASPGDRVVANGSALVVLTRRWHRALVVRRRRRVGEGARARRGRRWIACAAGRTRRCEEQGRRLGRAAAHARRHATPQECLRPKSRVEPWEVCRLTFNLLSDDDLSTCVHCGLCLDACPTFRATGLETESPRGRIYLMTQWKRGQMTFDEKQVKHIDLCLGCRTCEAVCPSGVPYGRIIEAGRSEVERLRRPAPKHWLARTALRQIVAKPRRLRTFGALTKVAQSLRLTSIVRSGRQLPRLRTRFQPPAGGIAPAIGARKHRVAFLVGCVMPILYPQSHEAAVKLLQLAGCEVWFPRAEKCCGALLAHNGDLDGARS